MLTPLTISVPGAHKPAPTPQQALEDLRKAARRRPALRLRLKRLARLLAAGRALKLTGDPCRVQATVTALRAYAAEGPVVLTAVAPDDLLVGLARGPVRVSVHDQDGWPICEYRLSHATAGVDILCRDGRIRFLPRDEFRAQFRLAVYTLRVPATWVAEDAPVQQEQAA
ncbi:hypothetical protein [Deinococcus xianganensis]|uniref:Uncharacterized protein n=1 Tax=Deinococcus xianganensis TaxID=1507289 RepID=A0A6I4YMJ2_9DEIO|nr:hypothetical protein [Deinococcus xianganensis]MXV21201.1 hypothetical protein [Deinococcus xianganensis]